MADAELDARVTALEENGGGTAQNGNKTPFLQDYKATSTTVPILIPQTT